ncbi:MAG: tight adherence protein B [Mariniblastus sp.]|jgi:tight adherence protein B
MMMYIMIGAIAVGIGGMIFAVSLMFQGSQNTIEDRLELLTQNGGRGAAKQEAKSASLLRSPLDEAPNAIEEFVKKFFNLRTFLESTGTQVTVSKFVMMTAGFAVVAGALAFVFLPWKSLVPVLALAFAALPLMALSWLKKRRLNKFGGQLPGALDLMSQALRAGQSLPAGIQLVGNQMSEPLGPEFHKAFEQQNLGMNLSDSLLAMTERVPNLDLRFFCTAVILQRQTGGDLAEILDKISHLIRERFQIRGQIQALTGEGRISGIVLLGLPPILFGVMLKLNYDYVMMLFTDPLGQKMLMGAVFLQFVGAFSIKKIIDIKV